MTIDDADRHTSDGSGTAGTPGQGSGASGVGGAEGSAEVVLWARQRATGNAPVTPRTRRIVPGLPAWEPLPPGEIAVRRHGQA